MRTFRGQAQRLLALGAVLTCLLLAWLPCARALDPDHRISQYSHIAWRVRDGAFAGTPTSIAQTADGYIWIGTVAGLVRFDGVRFVPFVLPAGKHFPNPAVFSLLGATDGSLWIGTGSGLAQWKNGELVNFPETAGRVNSIYEDRDGAIWIARTRTNAGGVCKVATSVATCYTPKDGVPPHAAVLIKDNLGYFLIGTDVALVRWKPGSSTSYELPRLKAQQNLSGISDLALAPDGSVWVGIYHTGHGLGLQKWVNSSWKTLTATAFDSSKLRVNGLRLDRNNTLWIATEGDGISRIHDGNVDHFGAADGLSSDSVEYAFEDREGNLWLTTAEGVDCFRSIPVVSFSTHEGLTANKVESILAAHDGTIWIGNNRQLDFVRGNTVSSISPNKLRGNIITSLFEDHTGRLWIGVDNGLFIYEHGRFMPVRSPDSSPIGIVLAITEDADNNVWAAVIHTPPGRPTKLICFRDGRFIKEISDQRLDIYSLSADPQSGLWLGLRQGGLAQYRNSQVQIFPIKTIKGAVNQVLANSDGSVLAATNVGLVEQRGDRQRMLDDKNGLPCNRIYALITDKHSDLWLFAECGLIKINSDELQRWRETPDLQVKFDLFDAFDGAQPYIPPFRPIATRSPDGRLWFANETVAQMIDPDSLLRNTVPPPVHIEGITADRKTYSAQSGIHLPALTRDLEIDYTALSFVVPQKVHFQYKLEGYDRDWQDAGTRRQAFYSNLPPRNYTFRVKACNNSGVWNEAGAALDFNITPTFYQTAWFRSLSALLFLAVLTGLYRLRLGHLERQRDALRKSEKELREVVDTIPGLIHTARPDGHIDYFNKRWLEYLGVTLEEVAGWNWTAFIHPEDVEGILSRWRECLMTGEIFEYETRVRRANGEYRWMFHRKVPRRDANASIVKWYGSSMDIHERKTAEEALRSSEAYLAEAQRLSRTGSFGWKPDTGEIVWSDETYRIFEYDQVVKPTIDLLVQRVHPKDRPDLLKVIESAFAGATQFEHTYRLLLPDGSIKHVHALAHALKDASGNREFVGAATDVTSIKRAEEELRKREKELRDVIDTIPAIVWSTLPDGSNTYVNKRFVEYSGTSAEQMAGLGWKTLIHPDDLEQHAAKWREALAAGKPHENEVRSRRSDGQYRWQLDRGVPLRDKDGNIIKWYGVTTDIEDRKRAEEALQRSKAYLAEAQRLSKTGSFAWSPTKDNTYYSDECCRLLGFEPNETPPPLEAVMERIHPEDQQYCRELIERSIHDKVDVEFDYRIFDSDKLVRNIHCVSHPVLDQDGNLDEFIGTVIDVTERKRAEQEREKLRQIEADLAHMNRVSMLGEMAASLAHELKQPLAAAITSANSCIEWLAHEPPNLDRARAAATRIDKYGHRAAEIIDHIRSFYKKSPSQRELVDVNGIVHEIFPLLQGEAIRYSITIRLELPSDLPRIQADRVQLQQVFMNLMLNAIEAMQDSGGELTVKSQFQDGQLLFSVSDTGIGLPNDSMDQIFSAFFTTKEQGSGMGLAISRSIVESRGGRLWATANDGRGATFCFTLPADVQ